jgi:hypothetical protein
LLETPRYVNKALAWAFVFVGGLLLGSIVEFSFHRVFEMKRYIKWYVKMPCKQVSLPIWAPWESWERGRFACRDFLDRKEQ